MHVLCARRRRFSCAAETSGLPTRLRLWNGNARTLLRLYSGCAPWPQCAKGGALGKTRASGDARRRRHAEPPKAASVALKGSMRAHALVHWCSLSLALCSRWYRNETLLTHSRTDSLTPSLT